MPIKLPKTFGGRRKSSGNILEEVDSQQQSSFRVFERPGPHRSITDGAPLSKRMSEGNAVPTTLEDSDNIFAGSEEPLRKNRGPTYESSTSTRLSSSSTVPSSTEIPPPDEATSPHSRIHDIPAPPPLAGALRAAAGRTFSFGGRFGKSFSPSAPRTATPDAPVRRAETSGTDSTATPPKLSNGQFNLGADLETGSTDDFGKMFDHLGKPDSAMLRDPSPRRSKQYSSSPPTQALPEFQAGARVPRPAPLHIDRSSAVEPSPYSWDSHHSRHSDDNLLNDSNVARMGELVVDGTSTAQNPETVTGFRRPSPSPAQMLGATTTHRSLERPRRQSDYNGLRRSGIYSGGQGSSPVDDEDARMVRQSLLWSKENSPPANDTPLFSKSKAASPEYLSPEPESMFAYRHEPDPSIADHARLAVQYTEKIPKTTSPGNKVMTPSQFEHYRQQQELRRSNSNASKSEDEDDEAGNEFDEEDEIEKQRAAERQRRKQEAHMSVYRQQMMKVTGQQGGSPFLHPVMSGASNSVPNLNRLSGSMDNTSSSKSNEEDDEEVPLGILAAHGFPNRNRPPTRLVNASSNPNLRASMQPPYASSASSVAGGEHGARGGLPVFARALPRDPYYGAGIVAGPNRESLAMGGGSGSVYGGSSSPVPPGGLVNVIAHEERARAMRRGSPNTQGIHNMGGVPRPYSMMGPQPLNPSEQAQVHLSRQMADMMQMQMQWMQQVMQMQGMQGTPPPMTNNGMLAPPGMGGMPMSGTPMGPPSMADHPMAGHLSVMGGNPNMRPVSMPGPVPGVNPNFDHRTLTMLDPNVAMRRTGSPMPHLTGPPFQPQNPGYASSIAPSERSNAGLASRYRPVSVMHGETTQHAPSHLNKGWADENQRPSLPMSQSQPQLAKSSSLATVVVRPVSPGNHSPADRKPRNVPDEDDDDEAWAEMMKKRDKKKSSWKLKRGTSSLGDLMSVVH